MSEHRKLISIAGQPERTGDPYADALLEAEAEYGSRGGHMLRRGLAARGWDIYIDGEYAGRWAADELAAKLDALGIERRE